MNLSFFGPCCKLLSKQRSLEVATSRTASVQIGGRDARLVKTARGEIGMARPKLPPQQRRRLTMTVRIRQDLDEGFAAVALLRGTTKSGLVSQYAAEQIRLEQERDRAGFAG